MPAPSVARRLVYLLAVLAPTWASLAFFTGGVFFALGPVRVSSTQPMRPLLIGLAAATYYVWRYTPDDRGVDGRWLVYLLKRALPFGVAIVVVLGLVAGLYYGSFAVAGSDSYGYVSQARLWLDGTPRVAQPWVGQVSWPNREWAFAPLGYRPLAADGTIVPTYPAGLPVLMAVFLGALGEDGPFYVVPICAALALWFTYLLGRRCTGSAAAAGLAALLLLTSPVFLSHAMVPMSDVPAAAGWALVALLALGGQGSPRPLLAGVAAGAVLLIRPNLLLLALVPVFASRVRLAFLTRYAIGLAPGLLALAAINAYLYGSPTTFGYGELREFYSLDSALPNLRNYAGWLVETQTPLVALALIPMVGGHGLEGATQDVSPRACLSALFGLTLLSYVCYAVFDHWLYLRFLLPAYPAVVILVAATVRNLCLKLPVEARVPAAVWMCTLAIAHGMSVGVVEGIFRQAEYERRHVRAAADVAARTPATAVILAVQHSGSVRYYASRITLRYDWLAADQLDEAVRDLAVRGSRSFVVVDDWEETEFRSRFASHSRIGRLDWPPLVIVPGKPEVRIYDLEGQGE